jgi:ABC-type nitrate/sulfonate/bicarbonate transport system substrate-binding protein
MSDPSTLWFTRCPAPSAASVAIRQGWLEAEFAPDGIAVRSLAGSGDKTVQLSHYRHSQPNSFRFGGYAPPLIAASRGADLKVIGLAWPDRAAAVLALPGSPIQGGEDLKGRRLAVPRRLNDSIDWWRATVLEGYRQALAQAGLGPADVSFVDIDIAREYFEDAARGDRPDQSLWGARSQFAVQREEAAALLSGQVDVIYSDAAMGALISAFLGLKTVVDLSSPEDQPRPDAGYLIILTASGRLLQERPDLARRWLGRLLAAAPWAAKHPDQTKRIIALDTGLPEDFVDAAYSPRVHRQLDVSLAANRLALLRAKHDHLLQDGFLAAPLELDALIDPRPLQEALRLQAGAVLEPAAP